MRRAVLAAACLAALAGCQTASPPAGPSKLETLGSILASRDDNDPRLDRDFVGLSERDRELFRRKYRELAPERRNERGTIVYLLGRNLRSSEDWAFLRAVAAEPACLSLADCSRPAAGGGESMGDEVTLAYPSLVALKAAQRALESGDASAAAEARAVVAAAKDSKMPAAARLAAQIAAAWK